jgi:hypothetical protein
MSLTDYVVMAFDPVPPPGPDARARLDALEGSVLLVPDTAMPAEPKPGAMLTGSRPCRWRRPITARTCPRPTSGPPHRPGRTGAARRSTEEKGLSQGVKVAIFIVIFVAALHRAGQVLMDPVSTKTHFTPDNGA